MDRLLRFLKGDYLALGVVVIMAVGIFVWVSVEFSSGSASALEKLSEIFLVQQQ